MILIYTQEITVRLKYIFDLIFTRILKTEFELTENIDEFRAYTGARISYGLQSVADELFFYADRLLFEKGIEDQQISVFEWEGSKAFFATHPKYTFPFDPFAASFYLVSRYEEYLPHIRDSHDRYTTSESLAYQKNFLQKPLVNIWAMKIKDAILKKYPAARFQPREYKFISTIDIDNAYAYLEKGLMRTIGALARSLVHLDFDGIFERSRVMLGMQHDPYDTFDYQLRLHQLKKVRSIYFLLLGEYGENDKNVPTDSKKFQSLIKSLADYSEVGIHPSYGSNKNPGRLKTELSILSKILKREVTKSRQHFLKLRLPGTYRRLIDLDIKDDYTMGYASVVGFRASICTPFNFYDLDLEQSTSLVIHPFAVMDATLRYYMKVNPEDAMDHIKPLINEVKNVEGTFISLWHNESMSENRTWKGWLKVYEQMVDYAAIN
jgi:hypothetical protein